LSLIRDTYFRFQVLLHEVAKFGVVGLIGFVVQLGVQNGLHSGAGIGPIIALVIGYVIATMVTFVGNRYWTFKHRKGKGLRHETIVFVLFNLVGIVIQVGIVDLAYNELGYKSGLAYNLATIIGIGLATLFRLFAYRKFVFGEHRSVGEEAADLEAASVRQQAGALASRCASSLPRRAGRSRATRTGPRSPGRC
jgi:putative flippase GtrA